MNRDPQVAARFIEAIEALKRVEAQGGDPRGTPLVGVPYELAEVIRSEWGGPASPAANKLRQAFQDLSTGNATVRDLIDAGEQVIALL